MQCWNCHARLLDFSDKKISFRATCDKCGAALHCCKNCKFYKPGLPNDCAVPDTDHISDRTATNFCEEFSMLDNPPPKNIRSTKGFDDLFKS